MCYTQTFFHVTSLAMMTFKNTVRGLSCLIRINIVSPWSFCTQINAVIFLCIYL